MMTGRAIAWCLHRHLSSDESVTAVRATDHVADLPGSNRSDTRQLANLLKQI